MRLPESKKPLEKFLRSKGVCHWRVRDHAAHQFIMAEFDSVTYDRTPQVNEGIAWAHVWMTSLPARLRRKSRAWKTLRALEKV